MRPHTHTHTDTHTHTNTHTHTPWFCLWAVALIFVKKHQDKRVNLGPFEVVLINKVPVEDHSARHNVCLVPLDRLACYIELF